MWRHGFVVREVVLVVRDLSRASAFYSSLLDVEPEVSGGVAVFKLVGSSLVLEEDRRASRPPPGSSGLYHVAFLVDSVEGLAEVFRRVLGLRLPLLGLSDHGCTLAVYTMDPDYNGVEVYWDREVEACKLKTRALDPEALLGASGGSYEVSIGHIHVKVPSLEEAEEFYAGALGMTVTERSYPGALFFSYGGYHHHVGANVWETGWGVRGARWVKGYTGMRRYTLSPPASVSVAEGVYVDPAGHEVLVRRS